MKIRKIYNTLKKENNLGKLIIGIMILVVVIGEGNLIYKSIQIKKYGEYVFGVITEYREAGWRGDYVTFTYKVKGKQYSNDFGVYSNSDKKLKKEFGRKFKIRYSKKNPKYSIIYLEEFEDLRNTIEHYDF